MAAPRGGSGMDADTDSDSDSDSDSSGEAAARFREAAWDCAAQAAAARTELRGGGFRKDQLQPAQPSLRRAVNGHAEDGNELQTTPEFRAHVAKKLGAMLDSFITVLKDSSGPSQTAVQESDSGDDGFRLFSSSVPGDCGKSEPCPAARQRQPSSSRQEDPSFPRGRFCIAALDQPLLKQRFRAVKYSGPSSGPFLWTCQTALTDVSAQPGAGLGRAQGRWRLHPEYQGVKKAHLDTEDSLCVAKEK